MNHSTRFERLLLSATAVASVTLWGLWASAAPAPSRLETCEGLAGIAWSVAVETGHTDPDAAYEDTLAACMGPVAP